ncbi:MAG TPA: DMT family transporter, partial [Gammaproteobacteria bacterium]|nr:DMT family transporter [Gammaproteobacteria bacterium]
VAPVGVLLFSAVLWGLTWWPLRYFHQQGLAGASLIFFAYGSVGALLLPLLAVQRGRWGGQGRYLLLIVLLGGFANLSFATVMTYGNVVRAMVLFYLAPVWGVLGGRLFLGERIDAQRWLGVALALLGALLVLGGPGLFAGPPSGYDLLALSSGFTFAMNNVTFRATQRLPVASKVAAMFAGCLVMAGVLLAVEQPPLPPLGTGQWLILPLFGVGWLLLATVATQWAVTHLEAGRASIILIAELVAAVVSATLIGGETVTAVEALGGLLILGATMLEAWRPPAPRDCRAGA